MTVTGPTPEPSLAPATGSAAVSALYLRHAPDIADASGTRLPSLDGAAASHLRFAARRSVDEALVRATPTDGAPDGHLTVEIVTDDMPFLVGAVLVAVGRAGREVRRLVHPIVVVRRDGGGNLTDVLGDADPAAPPAGAVVESWIHLDLATLAETRVRDESRGRPDGGEAPAPERPEGGGPADLERTLARAVAAVRRVVADGPAAVARAREVAERLRTRPAGHGPTAPAEIGEFLRWLVAGHFTFVGHRAYDADGKPRDPGLGVLSGAVPAGAGYAPGTRAVAGGRDDLVITRASTPSPLRNVHPYVVVVADRDAHGAVIGEDRFVGMLTVPALFESVLDIPVVQQRVRDAIRAAGFTADSYSGQQMLEVISGLPREELLTADRERLHDTAVGVLAVTGQRAVRVFLRRDPFRRFISCLVYLPRDRYTTTARLAMADVLQRRLGGTSVDHTAGVSEAPLALVHFTVHTGPDAPGYADVDTTTLQDELAEAARTWEDRLVRAAGPAGAAAVAAAMPGIPESYRAVASPERAVADLEHIARLAGTGDIGVRLYLGPTGEDRRFTFYLAGEPATLTAVLPVLQQLGTEVLDERPAELVRPDGLRVHVYDFGLRLDEPTRAAVAGRPPAEIERGFCSSFQAAWTGAAESDGFSALMLRAGLGWREVVVLRAYARYTRQLGSPYGHQYMATTLLAYPAVAHALVELFRARFDPSLTGDRDQVCAAALARTRELIDAVTGLDADRILRGFLAMITATWRTNHYRGREFLSLKLDPSAIPDMPAPRPMFEIFVYSPRVEGVHLRFGPVARGGLRWSDRPQDFRTEILGLVKAQAVKNAVIVPVGAKGGFFVRNADRGPVEVEACYRTFISGLLDVTDNLVDGATVPPPDVVRHDGDDSYLVVAADKGTARFSDTANEVAASYGFWLGDAFASGGSVGYDHKAMGITAKGAWESVRRHFRELGVDTQTQDFTVVGVGDMSGDVFGNGMLLSRHIRLVAAFDHRHVFVDPDPDAERSFVERERMFALPRSTWEDYDRSVISAGGGVWPRTAKSVPVGPQMRASLGLADGTEKLSPPELIAAILRAPADLLWNGGIGTYVKATEEPHDAAGDKANDAVRADGRELRVKVVGEGGNLGLTQKGRIEFARAGGKINTDAIDNSAGVDCSDHEVNIKILLDRLVAAGDLARDDRNAVLVEMTDEVGALVLADNTDQNVVLGIARAHAPSMVSVHARLTADLQARRGLVRKLEVLPDDAGFAALEADGAGLTSPELSTLLAHTKLDLTAAVLATDLPDNPAFAGRLPEYFPHAIRERFPTAIAGHPLRREIIATLLVNEMVDGAGMTYAFRIGEELAASAEDAVRAYAAATAVFDLPSLWQALRSPTIPTAVSDAVVLESRRLLDRASRWFLTNRPQPLAVSSTLARFAGPVRTLQAQLPELLRGKERAVVEEAAAGLTGAGLEPELAQRCGALVYGYGLLDVVELMELAERDREPREAGEVVDLYFAMSEHLGIDLALTSVSALERGDRWHALARLALRDDLYGSLRSITLDAMRESGPGASVHDTIAAWERANASRLVRARASLQEIGRAGQLDLATLSVVSRELRGLAR